MLTPIIFPIWIAQNAGKSENSGKPQGFGTWFAYQALWARLAAWKADSSTSDLKALALEISCFQSFRIWVGNISWSTESVANSIVILVPQLGDCVCVCQKKIYQFLAVVLLLWVEMIRWHLSSLVRLITSCWYSKLPQQSLHQGPAFLHTDPQPMIRQFQVSYFCGILWYSAHNIHNCSFSRTSPWLSVNKILCASEGPEVGDVLSFSRDGDRNPVPPLWA